jgi:hypothetical protein
MGLKDDIIAAGTRSTSVCVVCSALDELAPTDRVDLEECLADATITGAAIARVLNDRGLPVHPDGKQVRRHRQRCS